MSNWDDLSSALNRQKEFSDLFFAADQMSQEQKQEMLKTFVLAMHADATGICEAVNYKDHRRENHPIDTQKILYKSVDVFRYVLAILNLWGINKEQFTSALAQKDDYLHYRNRLTSKSWSGQPVVLFDLDDVLAEFRDSFCKFVTETSGIFLDPMSKEYYNMTVFKQHGLSNELYFNKFMDNHGFLNLAVNQKYLNLMKHLKGEGYWIQVVTARPDKNLTCFYDTYSWLYRNEIPADGVAFATEKFSWLTHQKFYGAAKYFAVDDSAKHSAEYAKHGVEVIVPEKTYNTEVKGLPGITYVSSVDDPISFVKSLV